MVERVQAATPTGGRDSDGERLIRAVLFDLDGTLADTAPDLGAALNTLRRQADLDELPLNTIRPWVSKGARGLIQCGFGLDSGAPEAAALVDALLDHYAGAVCVRTRLFPGMDRVLDQIESRGLCWGIVTNKPRRFTHPLMDGLGLSQRAGCLVCGDTLPVRKPDPAPIHLACAQLRVPPSMAVMVGDDRRDILAARAAGAWSLAATYGYVEQTDPPGAWPAHGLVHQPTDLLNWLDRTS
ncbi:MAG: HAD-IA family hydrolase [Pseudomonadota bacterium]|nr:HAD-IA family hydrolase [Pseudomonadota bacterium]